MKQKRKQSKLEELRAKVEIAELELTMLRTAVAWTEMRQRAWPTGGVQWPQKQKGIS